MTDPQLILGESEILARYFVGHLPESSVSDRYKAAVRHKQLHLSPAEERLMRFMLSNEGLIGCIDTALARTRRHSVVRKRLILMLAILEATPECTSLFLPVQRSRFYLVLLGFKAGYDVLLRASIGRIFLALYR